MELANFRLEKLEMLYYNYSRVALWASIPLTVHDVCHPAQLLARDPVSFMARVKALGPAVKPRDDKAG